MELRVVNHEQLTGGSINSREYNARKRRKIIMIEHNGAQLLWNFPPRMGNMSQGESEEDVEIFNELNMYIATLPVFTQDAMFAIYSQINYILKAEVSQDEVESIIESIRPLADNLFSLISEEHLYNWTWTSLRPRIPADIKEEFNDSMPGTPERTYLNKDYKALIPLAIVMRLACPFWFEFAYLTRDVLNREHRDVYTYSLIQQSWPAACEAMERLELFTDYTIGNDRNSDAAVLAGISSEEFVYWTLSSTVVKRLTIVDVMGGPSSTPVVSALFNHIRYRVQSVTSSSPQVTHKYATDTGTGDENNLSYLEGFRNRQAMSIGQEMVNIIYIENTVKDLLEGKIPPNSLLDRVAPGIDVALVQDALISSKRLQHVALIDQQVLLAAWLFHPYNQARAVGNFKKSETIALLALAQAVYLHFGEIDLAKLVTSEYTTIDNNSGIHRMGDSVDSLRPGDREILRKHFPVEHVHGKKIRNPVINDVEELVKNLDQYEIECTFSDNTLRALQGKNVSRAVFLPRNFVKKLIDVVRKLSERPIIKLDPDEVYQKLIQAKLGA